MFSSLCSSVYDLSKDGALWEHCSGTYGRGHPGSGGGSGEGGRIMTEDIERAVRRLPKAMSRMRLVRVPGTQFVDTVTTGTELPTVELSRTSWRFALRELGLKMIPLTFLIDTHT